MFSYVPSPTQGLIQLTESESANGESSLLIRRMNYGTAGYRHNGEGWARRICRKQQARITDWCRIEELSDSMDPTQKGGSQLEEARGAAGSRVAGELVLVEHYIGIRAAGRTTELLGLRPGAHWPRCSYCWRRTLMFGTCEECIGVPCLRYCCQTFDDRRLCPEHWPRRPASQWQFQQIGHQYWTLHHGESRCTSRTTYYTRGGRFAGLWPIDIE